MFNNTNIEILFQILLVVLISGIIGHNREKTHQIAGVRTHVLVAIGSLLSIVIPLLTYQTYDYFNLDPFRLSAQVISGIGFLGAGTIIKSGKYIKGLTTAASLWVTAIIAITIGAGYYSLALVAFTVTIAFLTIYGRIRGTGSRRYDYMVITVKYLYTPENKNTLMEYLNSLGISDKYETILSQTKSGNDIHTISSIKLKYRKNIDTDFFAENLIEFDFIEYIKFNSEMDKIISHNL